MKKISLIIAFVALSCVTYAQKTDRTKAPKAGKAVVPTLPKTATFTMENGLKVYVVQNTKVPRVAFSLVLDRAAILEGDKTGAIDMAGQMMLYGTKKRTKVQLDSEIDFIGATLSTSSTGLYAECLKKNTDILLDLASDVVINPTFPETELEKLKKQAISGLKSSQDDANAISNNIVSVMNYGKMHPYGEITTEKTVQNISVNDCKAYYSNFFRPNIGYMAIVGDITEAEAKTLMNKYFKDWKKQPTPPTENYKKPSAPATTQVAVVEKTGAVQTVLSVTYPIDFKITSPDYLKAVVLNQILGGSGARLYLNLREDKGFTYGAYSSLTQDNKEIGNFNANASVRTEVTDSSVTEFLKEMRRIREEKVTEKELMRIKATLAGNFARSMESPNTIASYAINIARYGLSEDYYKTYLTRLEAITINDIQEMAKKYILPENANIVAVGDTKILKTKLAKFGKLTQYDMYGNVDAGVGSDLKDLLKGMTAEKVLANYVTAIGGEKKLREVKTLRRTISFEVQPGMFMDIVNAKKLPNKTFVTQGIAGMGESKTVFDGTKCIANGNGQKRTMEGKDLEKIKNDAKYIFRELDAKTHFSKVTLGEVKMIEGKSAFEVTFTTATGESEICFYDTKTGLLARTITGGAEITITGYAETAGIKMPSKGDVKAMGQSFDGTFKNEINPVLEDSLFKVE